MDKETTCCFSGHRNIPESKILSVMDKIEIEVIKLVDRGVNTYLVGGAVGFDTFAAAVVLDLKKHYPHLKLILALPCPQQSRYWSKGDVVIYEDILRSADDI